MTYSRDASWTRLKITSFRRIGAGLKNTIIQQLRALLVKKYQWYGFDSHPSFNPS